MCRMPPYTILALLCSWVTSTAVTCSDPRFARHVLVQQHRRVCSFFGHVHGHSLACRAASLRPVIFRIAASPCDACRVVFKHEDVN